MGRFVKPEEIAYTVIYYMSDASQMITGTSLVVDGGTQCDRIHRLLKRKNNFQFTTRLLYEQISDRFIKVVWTHKTHEYQADIFQECTNLFKLQITTQ